MNIKSLKGPKSDNQYQEIDFFKKGGMGEIYTAIDFDNKTNKAIKIVSIENDDEHKLLVSEFIIAASLNHTNIVSTEFFDEFENKGVKYVYCVMPFNKSGNLRDFLKSQIEILDLRKSIDLMIDLSNGLAEAHKKVIHRDLKPENILLNENGKLQICDFGLAKIIDAKTRTRTFKGSGTLPYMAPECWMYDSNTICMDIYSLGIIFFEILTLQLPFKGNTEQEFRDKHLYDPLPNILNIRRDLPIRLVEMIAKMTNKRPQDRYSSMSEIIKVLEDLDNSIGNKNENKIDLLLHKANQKISATQKEELERKKVTEKIDSEFKFIEFSIKSLFDKFSNRINEINKSLERTKIQINNNFNQLTVSFMGKSFSISFYPSSSIQETIKKNKEASLQYQKRHYGFVMQTPENPHLEKDNVVLIGEMVLSKSSFPLESLGYNLLLRKVNQDDLYGEWWVVWFEDSGLSQKRPLNLHYAIKIPDFYQEYEFGRGRVMHIRNMHTRTLEEEGIDTMIEKILE